MALSTRLPDEIELHKAGEVHSHKGNERAEVQHFGGELVTPDLGEDEGQDANDQDVDGGYVVSTEVGEGPGRQNFIAPHAVEQPGRPQLSGERAAEARNEE